MKNKKYIIMATDTEKGKIHPEYPVSTSDGIVGFDTLMDAESAIVRLTRPSPWAEQFGITSQYRIATVAFYTRTNGHGHNIDDAIMDMIITDLRKQGR